MRQKARTLRHFIIGAAIFVMVFGFGGSLLAQFTTATLGVSIVDSSGAAVPDATITIRNLDTGLHRTAVSGSNGSFTFNTIPIGHYAVSVQKTGFATFTQTGITLTVNELANIPVKLTVGNVTQQVRVTAGAQLINTQSATVAQLISNESIVNLPLNGREPQALLFLAAGTVNETGKYCLVNCQGGVYPGEQDASVGGGGPREVNYLMDGGSHNDTYVNTNLPFPNPDAIQEFNVQTDNLSAQFGIGAGAVVNIVTKSGTNRLHGSLFEFVRNGDMNAKNYFAPTHDTLKRNQYGFSVGGPVLKNKLFFFGTYQGTRIRSSAQGNVAFVPTAAERTGDFSSSGITVNDPATGIPYPGDIVPTNQLSAPAQFFLSHIPLPNGPNGQLTYQGASVVQNDDQYLVKINWNQPKNVVTGSWFWTRFSEPPDTAAGKTNLIAADGNGNEVTVKNLALNDTYSLSTRVLFNTWYSWTAETGGSLSGAPFGFPDAGIQIAAPTPPEIAMSVTGFFSVNTNHLGTFNRGDYSIREDVTMEKGPNEFQFGGQALHLSNNLINTYNMSGNFTFGNALSGSNISDFLLGAASHFQQGGGEYKDLNGVLWSLYVQDSARLTSNLKVSAGLRWDPYYPYTEKRGRIVCYVPGLTSTRFPNAPVGMIFGGSDHDAGCPKGGSANNANNFAPRLGFTYQVNKTTVVRGGAGLYFSPYGAHDTNGMVDTAPFSPLFSYNGIVSFSDPFSSIGIPNPFPAEYASGAPPTASAQFTPPVSIYATFQPNWHMNELATWNLNVEHQLGPSWVAKISYSGNKGTHLSSGVNSFNEQNPAVYIPGDSTEANTQQRRLNPQFGNIGLFSSYNNSHYNSLRLIIQKRFNHGFSFLANYTYSRMFDDFGPSAQTDPFNRKFDRGRSTNDVPDVLNISAVWQIPAAPALHGISAKLLNGWGVTGLANWRSGFPYSVFSNVDRSFSGVGQDYADYVGGNINLDRNRSHRQLAQEYFNVSAFTVNAIGTFGNSGKNILRGPGYFDTDMSLLKNFSIFGSTSLQFRAEFFNLFNTVNFSQPSSSLGTSSTGQITSASDPRILQLALKLAF